jgi:hypothetical protein
MYSLKSQRIFLYIIIWLFVLFTGSTISFAYSTSLGELLSRSKFTIVTTESAEKLTGILQTLSVNAGKFYAVSSQSSRAAELSKADVLVIVDRQKAAADLSSLDRLVGIPAGQIESNAVMVTVYRKPGAGEGVHIMITAPDEKRLYDEMDSLSISTAYAEAFEDIGFNIVRQYNIVPLQIVSNVDKQIAADWITSISKPGGDIYDWIYRPLSDFKPTSIIASSRVFLLNSTTIIDEAVKPSLPKPFADWLASDTKSSEQAAISGLVISGVKKNRVYAFAAPGPRLLASYISRFNDYKSIPEKLDVTKLNDLSGFKRMGVVVCRKNTSGIVLEAALGILNDRLMSALTSLGTGITFIPMQDLTTLSHWEGTGNSKATNSVDGNLVLQISDYKGVPVATVPSFTKQKPKKPVAPAKSDPSYSVKLKNFRTQQANYLKQTSMWESSKRAHQKRIMDTAKQWSSLEPTLGIVSISGDLRIYGNSSQSPVFETPFSGSANTASVQNPSIIQAFVLACKDMATKMTRECVFPADIESPVPDSGSK